MGRLYCLKCLLKRLLYAVTEKNNRNSGSNVLNRQFKPKILNLAWISDITYIRTVKGICYLCVVIDLFSRKVIAWNVNSRQNTKLVYDTLLKA